VVVVLELNQQQVVVVVQVVVEMAQLVLEALALLIEAAEAEVVALTEVVTLVQLAVQAL
jgi:hypothetical protein